MKRLQILFILIAFALGTVLSAPALARGSGQSGGHSSSHSSSHSGGHGGGHGHGRAHVGVFIGPVWYPPFYPYYYPPYYYAPYYSYPPVSGPPTYIEQAPAIVPGYWYYCGGAQAYYPTVQECPGGWQRVAPQPPG
jgi:hypothetical protein